MTMPMRSHRVYLDPKQVPANLRANYKGRHLEGVVCVQMSIPMDAGLWSGGSRDTYDVVRLEDGAAVSDPAHKTGPFPDSGRRERIVQLEPGFCVRRWSIARGKDRGLTFYLHPDNAAALLPPAVDLSADEKIVLATTRNYKSSYNGRDRYDMASDDARYDRNRQSPFMSRQVWNDTKAALISRGMLNKAGAITTKGLNAIDDREHAA